MKTPLGFQLLLLAAMALPLVSCVGEGPPVYHQVPFNESEFKWVRNKGTAEVEGRAFIELKNRSLRFADHRYILILPVNAFTTEFVQHRYEKGENMEVGDSRIDRYMIDSYTRSDGRFDLTDFAPGEYYLCTTVNWSYTNENDDGTKSVTHHYQYIWSKVSLQNGMTTHILSWNQGADKRLD